MWVITTSGFYSAVAHREHPELLLVRARAKGDLTRLKKVIPGMKIREDRRADYRWRTVVTREEWAHALVLLAADVDYDNFKNAVRRKHSRKREGIYHRVWSALTHIERGFEDRYYSRWARPARSRSARTLWELPDREPAEEVRAGIRETLEFAYGENPQSWPAWNCEECGQLHSGWDTDDCGRCGAPRPFPEIDETILEEWVDDGR